MLTLNENNCKITKAILDNTNYVKVPFEFSSQTLKSKMLPIEINAQINGGQVASIIGLPLISTSNPDKKQGILLKGSGLDYSGPTKQLIKETLMSCWEIGYHVAFCKKTDKWLYKYSFCPVSKTAFQFSDKINDLMYYNLSWKGLDELNPDLRLPFNETI